MILNAEFTESNHKLDADLGEVAVVNKGGGGGASVVYISLAYSDDEFFAENASCKEILDYVNDDKNVVLVYEEDGMAVCFYLAAKYEERCEFVCISSLFSFGLKVYATHIERFEPSSSGGGVSTFDVYTYWNWDEDVYGGLESSCSYEDIVSAYNNGNIVQLRGYHEDGEVRFYHLVTYMEESHFQFARETLSGTEFISVEWDSNWYISVVSSGGGSNLPETDAWFGFASMWEDEGELIEDYWGEYHFVSGMTWREYIDSGLCDRGCCTEYYEFFIDDERVYWQGCPECDGMTRVVHNSDSLDDPVLADDEIRGELTYYIDGR